MAGKWAPAIVAALLEKPEVETVLPLKSCHASSDIGFLKLLDTQIL